MWITTMFSLSFFKWALCRSEYTACVKFKHCKSFGIVGYSITLALNNMIYWQIQTCHNQSNQYLAIQPHLVLQPHAVVTVPG